nr:hypothetical protein CFP56_78420 [Quercus suber]
MAAAAMPAPNQSPLLNSPVDSASPPPVLTSRNPLPLTSNQESQVRELYYKRVRNKCADEVRAIFHILLTPMPDFAACCTHRTFTATIMCRSEQRAMNTCMKKYATQAEHDAAREEWFATMDIRRREREEKEEKRKKDEVFWREWWDKEKKTEEMKGLPGDKTKEQGKR